MALTRQHERFLNKVTEASQQLCAGLEAGEVLSAVYADVAAGGNPPTDEDCRTFIGFGLAEIGDFVDAVTAFAALRDGGTPTAGEYGAFLNLVRSL
jgi:hypothetical protein